MSEQRNSRASGWKSVRRSLLLALCLGVLAMTGMSSTAQAQSMDEYEAKAAVLFKVINFVEWPPTAGHELVTCFVGADPASYAMQHLVADKTKNGKPIVIRRVGPEGDLKGCQVLYIGASVGRSTDSILDHVRGDSVLTVGEVGGFGQKGGVLNLLLSSGRIRFEVNPNSANRAHLQISSRLLSLATLVTDKS